MNMPSGETTTDETGWTDADVPRLDGRRYIVTGANSGLGFETSRVLVRQGAQVVMACRDPRRGADAVARVAGTSAGDRASLSLLDLGDLRSIAGFAAREVDTDRPLDGIVCNAGLMAIPQRKTADGFEMTIGVNHLGHFALVGRLLEKLESQSAAGRVVVVSSGLHKRGNLELLDDLFFEKRPYQQWTAYHQSKLANLLFALELGRRLEAAASRVRAVAAHPGFTATELQSQGTRMGGPRWQGMLMALAAALIAQKVVAGAWPQLRATTDPKAKNGDYFGPKHLGETRGPAVRVQPSRDARDAGAAHRLWVRSEELTQVHFPSPRAASHVPLSIG